MATNRELIQSALTGLVMAQNADEDLLNTPGVDEILREMDSLAMDLMEVLG